MVALTLGLACLLLSLDNLVAGSHVRMEPHAPAPPDAWTSLGPSARQQVVELVFAVRQRGRRELEDRLLRVSSPSSPDYGKHMTNEEVQELTRPEPGHVETVLAFLRDHGVEARAATPNSDMISATVTVETAEKLLSAKYEDLSHSASGVTVSRTLGGYALPAAVAAAVDFVAPTVHVPGVRRPSLPAGSMTEQDANALSFNSPKNLRQLYNVGNATGKAAANKQAVTAFLEQGYGENSLRIFWRMFCSGITCGKGLPKLVGDATGGSAGTESMLDIETITGVAGNVESEFWGFSGRSPDNVNNEPFLKWLVQMSKTSDADVPKVFSTSYGEDEGSWSKPAAERLNVEFQKAGVRGISLLYASGDEGANCKGSSYVPEGPGSSPYVTAVGGTKPGSKWPQPGSESAVGLSSGGFSNYWPMPDYQKDAVAEYLKQSGLPDKKVGYNVSGRAYPDISAQATNFFVWAGLPQPYVSGTSCASPTAAGVIALLNDVRLQSGKSTLGFLNPLIYENLAAFNDITEGSSGGGCGFGTDGWPAKKGWDAVTGVGTPDYARLASVVEKLPAGNPVWAMGTQSALVV
eukprot:TRINITY_DN55502_c0_g1_i1.p1 TRINITY_DN55502_c0_g1~~TRINITY_DN55502_c0_g1_i1.p1  ORF type:complete len:578 (-),score=108.93 TRINITY_DN55502_c0_g1_i1:87-1820(-)